MLRNESKYNQIAYFNERSHKIICQISEIEAKTKQKFSKTATKFIKSDEDQISCCENSDRIANSTVPSKTWLR